MVHRVYLDNSATTPVAPEVVEAMIPYFDQWYGNPSSLHEEGQRARQAVEDSRGEIASYLGVQASEILFTSGATEANNLAIQGLALARPDKRHIITSKIEHHAVLHTCQWLEKRGYALTALDVDAFGRVDLEQLHKAIDDNTLVVSIMAGNNEIGTLQPLEEIGTICEEKGIPFHTDAVQAFGKISLPIQHIDLLSVSAHKLHGPKGIGFLYVRRGISLSPLFHGGGHERGRRSGTENVSGIVGMAMASRLAFAEQKSLTQRMNGFRKRMIRAIEAIPASRLNGHPEEGLPHIINVSFAGIEGESLVMRLSDHGIAVSTGSACSSPTLEPSHVLLAIGVPISMAHGSLRISTGRQTTNEDINVLLNTLPNVVDELRTMSPFKVSE